MLENVLEFLRSTFRRSNEKAFDFSDVRWKVLKRVEIETRTTLLSCLLSLSSLLKVAEKDNFDLITSAIRFYKNVLSKILEKSPISHALVRNLSCLDPRSMIHLDADSSPVSRSAVCKKKMRSVLNTLCDCKIVVAGKVDIILDEFDSFYQNVVLKKAVTFAHYEPYKEKSRVDEFYINFMDKDEYKNLWKVVKITLLLSHGQASVERGFSVNKNLEVENLKEQSYIAQRYVHEFTDEMESLSSMVITKELRQSVSGARSRYATYLEEEKKIKALTAIKNEKSEKTKSLQERKRRLCEDVKTLEKGADDLAEQAEKKQDLSLIVKSNSFRQSAKRKKEELAIVEGEISKLSKQL